MGLLSRCTVAAAFVVWGCGPSLAPVAEGQLSPLRTDQVEDVVERVALVRGMELKRPVPITRLDDAAMVAALRKQRDAEEPDDEAEAARLAFNLHRTPRPRIQALLEKRVLGFYDSDDHELYYRAASPHTRESLFKQRIVIAHEVHHALQHDAFGAPAKPATADGRLALRALYEGDAQVAAAAFVGSEQGAPLGRTLRRLFDDWDEVKSEEVAGTRSPSTHLTMTRRILEFPYVDGMRFVADIYRVGGFELVNAVYERPPHTTEQILHPNKYLAGEGAIPVDLPPLPPGYRAVEEGTLGELVTGQVLATCVGEAQGMEAARGWGGDRYRVATKAGGRVSLSWVSAWDDDASARRFEDLLRTQRDCWADNEAGPWTVADHMSLVREGRKVAVVTGLSDDPALAAEQLSLVGEPPAREPVTEHRVPEKEPVPSASRGVVKDGDYVSGWLGITADIPEDFSSDTRDPTAELLVKGEGGVAVLFVSDRVHTPAYNDATFNALRDAVLRKLELPSYDLSLISDDEVTTPLGPGAARLWASQRGLRLRMILVPVCFGTGSYGIVQAYNSQKVRTRLDQWVASLQWRSRQPPLVCKKLNPR